MHRLRWHDLPIGLIGLAAAILLAVGIVIYGRTAQLHGGTFRMYVTTDEARGLSPGTEVWLDGQKVGLVRSIEFRPPETPAERRVVLALDVLESARSQIRRDSHIALQTGGSVLGDEVVSIGTGASTSAVVANGDTLAASAQMDIEAAAAQATDAMHDLPAIAASVKQVAAEARTAQARYASLGASGARGAAGAGGIGRLRGSMARLVDAITHGSGTATLVLRNDSALTARANEAIAGADSIFALMGASGGAHGVGRFRRDSTLPHEITRVRDELAAVQSLAARPGGTLRRATSDSALMRGVARDFAALDSLLADVQRHPFHYIVF